MVLGKCFMLSVIMHVVHHIFAQFFGSVASVTALLKCRESHL